MARVSRCGIGPKPKNHLLIYFLLFFFQTHSTITKKMDVKFKSFVNRWLDRNLSTFQRQKCSEWLMGRHEDLVKNATIVKQDNDLNRTPYRVYNRYKVERLENWAIDFQRILNAFWLSRSEKIIKNCNIFVLLLYNKYKMANCIITNILNKKIFF